MQYFESTLLLHHRNRPTQFNALRQPMPVHAAIMLEQESGHMQLTVPINFYENYNIN
jgi:hypothetical protein